LQALIFFGTIFELFFLGTKQLGFFFFFLDVNSTNFWKNFQNFYIEKIEKENLVTRVEFLGKGYQIKWPLGTDWEL
jgi:hypothetical protein